MKKLLLLSLIACSCFAWQDTYQINFQKVVTFKEELSDVEKLCDIQRNQITHEKYFGDVVSTSGGMLDNTQAQYLSSLGSASKDIREILPEDVVKMIQKDIACMTFEGAVLASSLQDGRKSIYLEKSEKGEKTLPVYAPFIKATKEKIYWSNSVESLYNKAMKEALSDNFQCKFSGKITTISCNKGSLVFDIDKTELKYKGINLYSQENYYGFSLSKTNTIKDQN